MFDGFDAFLGLTLIISLSQFEQSCVSRRSLVVRDVSCYGVVLGMFSYGLHLIRYNLFLSYN